MTSNSNELSFDQQVAVITGAGRGLGHAYALLLAARGAVVVVNDIDADAAATAVARIEAAGGVALAHSGNIADEAQARRLIQSVREHFGRIDIVINNAGFLADKSFANMEMESYRKITDIHLLAAAYCTHAAWPIMLEQQYGRVIFTSSPAGLWGNFGQANYCAAKLGVIGMMSALKLEGEKYNIRLNTVAPLAITRLSEGVFPDALREKLKPGDVAALVAYLCSRDCGLSGEIFEVGASRISRTVVQRSEGLVLDKLTPETVAGQIHRLCEQPADRHYASAMQAAESFFRHFL